MLRHWFLTAALAAAVLGVIPATSSAQFFDPIHGRDRQVNTIVPTGDGYFMIVPNAITQPTYLTSINYPLTYGAHNTHPYYSPVQSSMTGAVFSPFPQFSPVSPAVGVATAPGVGVAALPRPLAPAANTAATLNTEAATTASLKVRVPAEAEVFIQGKKMNQDGAERHFVSPPLNPGTAYTYEVKANWTENGKAVSRTQQVIIRAGDNASVLFLGATGPALRTTP